MNLEKQLASIGIGQVKEGSQDCGLELDRTDIPSKDLLIGQII